MHLRKQQVSSWYTLPPELYYEIIRHCDVRTLAFLLCAFRICWSLPGVPHYFGGKRQVVNALDRIRSEKLKSPWYHTTNKGMSNENLEQHAWSMLQKASVQVPYGRYTILDEDEDIDLKLDRYLHADHKVVIFNNSCNDTPTNPGFCILALHSREVMFLPGYIHKAKPYMSESKYYPPRGKLPSQYTWNYIRGGYLSDICLPSPL